MRITKKIISLLLVVSMLASFLAMTGFEASAALTNQKETDFSLHFDDTTRKFKILQIADIQTEVGDSNIPTQTKDTIRLAIARYQPDLIFLSGDQTQGSGSFLNYNGDWEDTIDIVFDMLASCGAADIPIVAVPGNHDYDANNSMQDQYNYYLSTGKLNFIDWDNNFSTADLVGAPGAGNVTISASSSNKKAALNFALFNSQGKTEADGGGYTRPGGDNDADYMGIVNWYTQMNEELASSTYSYKAQVNNSDKEYVPTFAGQHIIAGEIYDQHYAEDGTNISVLVPCSASDPGAQPYKSKCSYIKNADGSYAQYLRLNPILGIEGTMGEVPGSTNHNLSTEELYNALLNPGNCLGWTFGHDHDNDFDVTDAKGMHWYYCPGVSTESYLTSGDPGVRFFEFTLDDESGDVSVDSRVSYFSDMVVNFSDMDADRMEAVNSDGKVLVNTISVPQVIYVGAAGNNSGPLKMQEFGDTVQQYLVNYSDKSLIEQDLLVKACLPKEATNISVVVKTSNGTIPTIENVDGDAPLTDAAQAIGFPKPTESDGGYLYTWKYKVGSVLPSNDTVEYTVKYTVGDTEYTICNATKTRDIVVPAAYGITVSGWRNKSTFGSDNQVQIGYISTLWGFNTKSKARTNNPGTVGSSNHSANKINGYYDYTLTQGHDDAAKEMQDLNYTLWYTSFNREERTDGWRLAERNIPSPHQTDIYVDKSTVGAVSASDSRLDLGTHISFWNIKDASNISFTHVAGIGFWPDDKGYSYGDWDDHIASEAGTGGLEAGIATNDSIYAHHDYAANQTLEGFGTTHVNGISDANYLGNYAGNKNSFKLTMDTADNLVDGKDITMYAGVRGFGNSNGKQMVPYNIDAFYINLHVYDKSALRQLVIGELANPRLRSMYPDGDDVDAAWATYMSMYKSALAVYETVETNETNVDAAYEGLSEAIKALTNLSKQPDSSLKKSGKQQIASVDVPPIIYVGGISNVGTNGAATYYADDKIRTDSPFTDLAITVEVTTGVTDAKLTVINVNTDGSESINKNVTLSNTASDNVYTLNLSGTTAKGTISGGTATAGGSVYYKITCKAADGTEYQTYAASYVKSAPVYKGMFVHRNNNERRTSGSNRTYIRMATHISAENAFAISGASAMMSLFPIQCSTDSFSEYVLKEQYSYKYNEGNTTDYDLYDDNDGSRGWSMGSFTKVPSAANGVEADYWPSGYNTSSWAKQAGVMTYYSNEDRTGSTSGGTRDAWFTGLADPANSDPASANEYIVVHYYYDPEGTDIENGSNLKTKVQYQQLEGDKYPLHGVYRGYNVNPLDSRENDRYGSSGYTTAETYDDSSTTNKYLNIAVGTKKVLAHAAENIGSEGHWEIGPSSDYDGGFWDAQKIEYYEDNVVNGFDLTKATTGKDNALYATMYLWYYGLNDNVNDGCNAMQAFHFRFNAVDRSSAHDAIDLALEKAYCRSDFEYELDESSWWHTYRDELLEAYVNCGNLWDEEFDDTLINNKLANPEYKKAKYDELYTAINTATNKTLSNGNDNIVAVGGDINYVYNNIGIKANEADDDRYEGQSFVRTMYENNAADLIKLIEERTIVYSANTSGETIREDEVNLSDYYLDFTYQNFINNYAKQITEAWNRTFLADADYTVYDEMYGSLYNAENNTIYFLKDRNCAYSVETAERTFADEQWWPATVFQAAIRNKFIGYVTKIDRTLKKPSEYTTITASDDSSKILRIYPDKITLRNGVTSPNVDECEFNNARNHYEALALRRAHEYFDPSEFTAMAGVHDSANGAYTVDGETYYAAYNVLKGSGGYTYTSVALYADSEGNTNGLAADEQARGYLQAKTGTRNGSTEKAVYEAGNNPINVYSYNPDGTVAETTTVAKYTAESWGTDDYYGFSDAYNEIYLTSGSNYMNGPSPWAIYIDSKILPEIAKVDYYYDRLESSKPGTDALKAQYLKKATYEKGGTGYDALLKYEGKLADSTGKVLSVDGEAWYTAESWAAYKAVRDKVEAVLNGITVSEGGENKKKYPTLTVNADGTVTVDTANLIDSYNAVDHQDAVNALTKELTLALEALEPTLNGADKTVNLRPTSDYQLVSGKGTADTLNKENYDDIKSQAQTYYNELSAEVVDVMTIVDVPRKDISEDEGANFETRTYYNKDYLDTLNGYITEMDNYKTKPLALNIEKYETDVVKAFADLYADKGNTKYLNTADKQYLAKLLNYNWIPDFDKYGKKIYDFSSGNFLIGTGNYTGADWYTAESWGTYTALRDEAAKEFNPGNSGYMNDVGKDSGIGKYGAEGTYSAIEEPITEQENINDLVLRLATAYYKLAHKKVSEFAGNIQGIEGTGYADINNKLDAELLKMKNDTVVVAVIDQTDGTLKYVKGDILVNADGKAIDADGNVIEDENGNITGTTVKYVAEEMPYFSMYDPADIEEAEAFKAKIVALEQSDLGPNFNEYLTAVNNYNTVIKNVDSALIYKYGWDSVFTYLNSKIGTEVTITSDNMSTNFGIIYKNYNETVHYAENGRTIYDIKGQKNTYDQLALYAKDNQSVFNKLVVDLYNELTSAALVPNQVDRAATAAREKIAAGKKLAYDPLQLNKRPVQGEISKYTDGSVADVEKKIAEIESQKVVLWETVLSKTGYNDNPTGEGKVVVDGKLADAIWAAAGLENETKTRDYETNRDNRYLLEEGSNFILALVDALEYAKDTLYEKDENGDILVVDGAPVVKRVKVQKGDGSFEYMSLYTDKSVEELEFEIAKGDQATSLTTQKDIDDCVFNILEQTDDTIALLTTDGSYYGDLKNVAEDDGLVYNPADYSQFGKELATVFPASTEAAKTLINQVWLDEDGNNEFELQNAIGAQYFTAATWDAYYKAYEAALGVDRNLTAADQEEKINSHTVAVYNTRNALEWKTINDYTKNLIDNVKARINTITTVKYKVLTFKNSAVTTLEDGTRVMSTPTIVEKELSPYGDISEITALWNTFAALYLDGEKVKENVNITNEADILARLEEINDLIDELKTKTFDTKNTDEYTDGSKPNEFTEGVRNLVDNFIAGKYTFNGLSSADGVGTYVAEYQTVANQESLSEAEKIIRSEQQREIQKKLNAIYTILGTKMQVGEEYDDQSTGKLVHYETAIEAVNTLAKELYIYLTEEPAQYAGFAVDMRQEMRTFFNQKVTSNVTTRLSAYENLFTKEINVFKDSTIKNVNDEIAGIFDETSSWPTISQLDKSVGMISLLNESYNYETDAIYMLDKEGNIIVEDETPQMNSSMYLLQTVGAYSTIYNSYTTPGNCNPHIMEHLFWLRDEAYMDDTEGKVYILADPGNAEISINGNKLYYNMDKNTDLDGNWYTKGYGVQEGEKWYYVAADEAESVTGSNCGGWFTNSTYGTLKTQIDSVDSLSGTYYTVKKGVKTARSYGNGTAAQAVYAEVETGTMLYDEYYCWNAEKRSAFISAVAQDQAKIDGIALNIYHALFGLELLDAVDAYREIAKLIYAALGKVADYGTDDDEIVIFTNYTTLENLKKNDKNCAQFFNMSLLQKLGTAGEDYYIDEATSSYYSPLLPAAYSGVDKNNNVIVGDECVKVILDYFNEKYRNNRYTIDMEKEVETLKNDVLAKLSALTLGMANLELVTSLVKAFLFNSSDSSNPNRENALGSYGENSDFFALHWEAQSALGVDQNSNVYKYKTSLIMQQSADYHETGFYDYTKYTSESLSNVINFLYDSGRSLNIIDLELATKVANTNYKYDLPEYTSDDYGTLYDCVVTEQEVVNEFYRELVDLINNLELKPASNLEDINSVIDEANDIMQNKGMYDDVSEEGKAKWEAFEEQLNNANAYKSATIINEADVDAAKIKLEDAIKALILNVDNHKPIATVYDSQSELTKFHNAHPELKNLITTADGMVAPSYMEAGLGNYTLYVYTNQTNPHIVVSLQDVVSKATGDKVITSKPEKMSVVAQAMEGVSAKVITPVLDEKDGTAEYAQSHTIAGVGADTNITSVSTQSAKVELKDENGEVIPDTYGYDETSSAYIILNPSFEGVEDGVQSAVAYSITATDSAVTKNYETGEITDNYNSVKQFNYASESEKLIDSVATDKITVFVYYMNAMPEGNDDNGVVMVDGKTTINASAVLTTHEMNGIAADKWTNHAMLYRTFAKPVRSWEFSETPAQLAMKKATYLDPTFGEYNYGSFVYVLNPNAEETSFDYKVAAAYFKDGKKNAEAAKETAISLLKSNKDYIAEFENYVETGSTASGEYGYKHYGANDINNQYENWTKPMGAIKNGTLVFIHVADRFGNVCNRIIEWSNYDPLDPILSTDEPGKVSVTEPGGSGINKVDLFKYMGTSGSSLYIGSLYKMLHIKGALASEGNQFTIDAGKENANKLFTVAVTDKAGNVGSVPVYADADGMIIITVEETFKNVANYAANTTTSGDSVGTQSGEDLGVIEFVFNGNETVLLNYVAPTSIVKAGPDGNVFANKKVPLDIIAKAEVESIKLYNVDNGTEEIWTAENATVKDNGDGTNKWTVKYTFTEGEHNYKATAMVNGEWEVGTVDFSFTATTKKIIIETRPAGPGRTELSYNDGVQFMATAYDKKEVPYGSVVKVVADTIVDGSEFYYWENDYTRRIISTSASMEFVAVTNMKLTAQLTTTEVLANDKKLVVYVNNAENVVDSFELADGEDYTVPTAPTLPEHVFKSWSMTKDEVLASEEKMIVVRPVYSLVVKNTVTLTEGNWTATGAGEYETVGDERSLVTVSTSATDDAGAGFMYWLDAQTGEIASYNRTYSFYVIKDTELTPVYGDASAVLPVPVARISTIKYDDKADKVSFFAERSVPAGYTMIQTGIVITKSASVANDEEAFILDASGVSKGMSKSAASNGYYSVSTSATSGVTVYARAFMVYANADGDIISYYSPVSSYTA